MENGRILLIDDAKVWPGILERNLSSTSHRVVRWCPDGTSALEALDAEVEDPETNGFDVVLLDGNFPMDREKENPEDERLDGEAARRMLEEIRVRKIGAQVIAFSSDPFWRYGIRDEDIIEMGKDHVRELPAILDSL